MTLLSLDVSPQVKRAVALFFLMLGMSSLHADPISQIEKKLSSALPKVDLVSVKASSLNGMYQVLTNRGEIFYVDEKAEYILSGDMFRIEAQGLANLTEDVRSGLRGEQVKAIDLSSAISFSPEGESKGSIYVFTDTDCGYCRKFHEEVPKLVAKGVTVHYLAWPRRGVQSPTGNMMSDIWCSEDQQEAMTLVKSGRGISSVKACDHPIQEHLSLGMKLGVNGTPAVFTSDGRQIGGYVPANAVLERMGL